MQIFILLFWGSIEGKFNTLQAEAPKGILIEKNDYIDFEERFVYATGAATIPRQQSQTAKTQQRTITIAEIRAKSKLLELIKPTLINTNYDHYEKFLKVETFNSGSLSQVHRLSEKWISPNEVLVTVRMPLDFNRTALIEKMEKIFRSEGIWIEYQKAIEQEVTQTKIGGLKETILELQKKNQSLQSHLSTIHDQVDSMGVDIKSLEDLHVLWKNQTKIAPLIVGLREAVLKTKNLLAEKINYNKPCQVPLHPKGIIIVTVSHGGIVPSAEIKIFSMMQELLFQASDVDQRISKTGGSIQMAYSLEKALQNPRFQGMALSQLAIVPSLGSIKKQHLVLMPCASEVFRKWRQSSFLRQGKVLVLLPPKVSQNN